MNRIYKSKRGFTLVEMMIVIAIIVMLAAVVGISLKGYLSKGNKASASIQSKRENFQSNNAAKNASFVAMGF